MSSSTSFDSIYLSGQLLTVTGGQLYLNGLLIGSGNFDGLGTAANTGQALYNLVTGSYATTVNLTSSGQALMSDIVGLSGAHGLIIASTGQTVYAYVVATSGAVGVTGTVLYNDVIGLSGVLMGVSGVLSSQITIAAAGVASLNGLSGGLTIAGVGNIAVSTGAGTVYVSGGAGLALATNLGTTGQNLYSDITGLSGLATSIYATITGLNATGFTLLADITGASGQIAVNVANAYATLTGVTATGQTLLAIITGMSGSNAGVYATQINVTLSGQTLLADILGLSGISASLITLALTGQSLYIDLTGLSGQANANFATLLGLALTGQILYGDVTSLSGVLGSVSGGLQSQIISANGTAIKVSGSNLFSALTLTGQNGTTLFVSGTTLFINSVSIGGYICPALMYAFTGSSFTFSNPTGYYTWSGVGTGANGVIPTGVQATGILPAPAAASGYAFTIKNQSPSGWLLISGYIDHTTNLIIYPYGSYDFWSDDNTWNVT